MEKEKQENNNLNTSKSDVSPEHLKNKENYLDVNDKAQNEPNLVDARKLNEKINQKKSLTLVKEKKKHKQEEISKREKEELAIEKYKDVPLGTLYNELSEMRSYVDILNQRRDELLRAKSHTNPKIRKEAIQKTIDNTFMIQFKYQDAIFRNHYQPTGLIIKQSEIISDNQSLGQRVMHRSQERTISNNSNDFTNISSTSIPLLFKNNEQQINTITRSHAGMERRDGRTIGDYQQTTSINPIINAPITMHHQGMENRSIPLPPSQQQQQSGVLPSTLPPPLNYQDTIVQQQITTIEQNSFADQAIKPIRVIDKPVVYSSKDGLDVWPLYEKIQFVLKNRNQHKFLLWTIIIFTILLSLFVIFFILWGFAVDWKNWTTADLGKAFADLFNGIK